LVTHWREAYLLTVTPFSSCGPKCYGSFLQAALPWTKKHSVLLAMVLSIVLNWWCWTNWDCALFLNYYVPV